MEDGNVGNNFGNNLGKPEKDDNRNIIKLEELREESRGHEERVDEHTDKHAEEEYLDESDLKTLIYAERGTIPSVVLDEIYDNLKGRRVSKKQLKKIISKVKESLDTESKIEKIDDLYKKLDALEKLLRNFATQRELKPRAIEDEAEEIILGAPQPESKESKEPVDLEDSVASEALTERVEAVNSETSESFEISETPESSAYGFKGSQDSETVKEVSGGNGGIEMLVGGELLQKKGDGAEKTNGIKLTILPPDSKRIIFLLKWIEYLVERVGYEELENVLDYYVDIGWISEEVLFSILRYAKGIKLYHEKSDWRPVGYLNVQDHIMSLMFIEALRTGKFSREKIMEVEREVFRMKREAMELNGI